MYHNWMFVLLGSSSYQIPPFHVAKKSWEQVWPRSYEREREREMLSPSSTPPCIARLRSLEPALAVPRRHCGIRRSCRGSSRRACIRPSGALPGQLIDCDSCLSRSAMRKETSSHVKQTVFSGGQSTSHIQENNSEILWDAFGRQILKRSWTSNRWVWFKLTVHTKNKLNGKFTTTYYNVQRLAVPLSGRFTNIASHRQSWKFKTSFIWMNGWSGLVVKKHLIFVKT